MGAFGSKSLEKLETCHSDLQKIAKMAVELSDVDFSINQGKRSYEKQLEYFLNETSRIDPRIESQRMKAKHLRSPSWAFDFKIYIQGHPKLKYDEEHLTYVAGIIITCGKILYEKGEVNHEIRSGLNWDRDGIILRDQKLWDRPHIELI